MDNLQYTDDNWLGDTPPQWPILPAKSLFSNPVERNQSDDIHLTPAQKYGVLPQSDYMEITGNRVVLNLSGADNMRHVEPGDYVSHLRSFQGGFEYSPFRGKISSAYTVFRPKRPLEPRFFKYLFKSGRYVQGLATTTEQLRDGQSIRYEQFALLRLPYPPLEEQKAIADFLDRELQAIDVLIGKQESLIAGLFERRASLVSTVTLNGVRGKCSSISKPIDWLPPVPAHWQIAPLWSMFRRVKTTGHADLELLALYREHGVLPKASRDDNHNVESDDLSSYQLVKKGDLVVNKMKAWQGSISLSPLEGIISPAYFVYRPHHDQNSRYFHYLLRSAPYVAQYNKISKGVRIGQWDLEPQLFRVLTLLVPTREEQNEIVALLDAELEKNTFLMDKCKRLVELLKERREALVSAAVTGKIEVRGKN